MTDTLENLLAERERRQQVKQGGQGDELQALMAERERRKQAYLAEEPPKAPPEMRLDPETGQMVDLEQQARGERSQQGAVGYAADLAGQYMRGTPFIGEYMDEVAGAVTDTFGGDGDMVRDRARARMDSFEDDNPKAAIGAQVAGGVVGSLPAIAAVPAAAVPASLGGKVVAGAGAGMAGGGADGAVSGYGAGTDTESRKSEATNRGVLQGALGAGLGFAAPFVASGAKKLAGTLVDALSVNPALKQAGIKKPTADMLTRALTAEGTFDDAARNMRSGNANMLVDAGQNTRALLDTAIQSSGPAGAKASKVVEQRATKAGDTMRGALDDALGPPRGVKQVAREISTDSSAARNDAYTKAYEAPIDYSSSAGRSIEESFDRVPPKTLKRAIEEANDAMRMDGIKNRQIMAQISDNGEITFKEMPNVQQADYVKRALDEMGQETDNFGRPTGFAKRARTAAKRLRDSIVEAVPEYGDALDKASDKLSQDAALDLGQKLFKENTTMEDVAADIGRMGKSELDRVKQGIRSRIDDTMAQVQRTITDPNVDAREATKALKLLSSRANKQKLSLVLGPEQSAKLSKQIDEAEAALNLKASVASNSKTFARQNVNDTIDRKLAPGFVENAFSLKPGAAKDSLMQALLKSGPAEQSAKRDQVFSELVDALTASDGPQKLAAMRQINKIAPGNEALVKALSRSATGASILPAYSAGRQQASQ